MKKIVGIIAINLVLVFCALVFCEFYCAFVSFNHDKAQKTTFVQKLKKTLYYSEIHYNSPKIPDYKSKMREIKEEYPSEKGDVLLLGCSFTYGHGLEDNEAFHSVLSDYTKRNVYNFGICGASPREMLYILSDKDLLNSLLPENNNIKYVIFTYIWDQKKRLYTDVIQFKYTPLYKTNKNGTGLCYYPESRIMALSFAKDYFDSFYYEFFARRNKKSSDLLKLYIKEINRKSQENFNAPKFIFLVYEDENNENFEDLKNDGITVIDVNKIVDENLFDQKYRLSDYHPSGEAWKIIVPELVKEIGM